VGWRLPDKPGIPGLGLVGAILELAPTGDIAICQPRQVSVIALTKPKPELPDPSGPRLPVCQGLSACQTRQDA